MRLSQLLRWAQQDGKLLFIRLFYYAYIPLILTLGLRTVDFRAFFPQLQK